ncbi:serine/threonine-protein kinase D2 [Silurus meridionalis]|nr:serine/threonine-protein kinase D2 [Silurus meridionalis]
MANSSPAIPSSPQPRIFFPPGGSSSPGCVDTQHATQVPLPAVYTPVCPAAVDTGLSQGPSGTNMSVLPPPPAGVSFIIQIGLTRESVLLPQTADLTYVKQIACSIVDQKRRDMGYISRRMLRMGPPGRRKKGRPRRRFMDVVREDMQVVGLKEADVEDREGGMVTDDLLW